MQKSELYQNHGFVGHGPVCSYTHDVFQVTFIEVIDVTDIYRSRRKDSLEQEKVAGGAEFQATLEGVDGVVGYAGIRVRGLVKTRYTSKG